MDISIIILLFISILSLSIILIIKIAEIVKIIGKKNKKENHVSIKRLKLILNQDNIIEKVDSLVDEIIKKAADTYMILNVNYDKEKYINSDESELMSKYIKSMVKLNMTPEIRELIGLVRVINSDKDLDDYLNLKIKIYVLAIMVNINKPL